MPPTPATHQSPERVLALWLPDWPITAWRLECGVADAAASAPLAIVEGGVVTVCSPEARAAGVRRGMRRRDAQARCAELSLVPADETREHRRFEPLLRAIEAKAPGVQAVRPGLAALRARGPARYYGGEASAAEVLLGALAEAGAGDARLGIADGLFTAEQAARAANPGEARIVSPGDAASFLSPVPLASAAGGELTHLLARLGVRTLGEFAALPSEMVAERFGPRGARLHELAAGADSRPVTARTPPPELHREVAFEPPLALAEQLAFGVRQTADALIEACGDAGLVCTEIRIALHDDTGEVLERVWLHPTFFDAAEVVDRVRWQLEGATLQAGIARAVLTPACVDTAHHHAPALFGQGPDERLHHALSRVQGMLGHRAVLVPELSGGRWLAERQRLVPWGDRAPAAQAGRAATLPWPGALPAPLPPRVFATPPEIEVRGGDERPITIDERGELSDTPTWLVPHPGGAPRRVQAWAGPWGIHDRGWDAAHARHGARLQLVDEQGTAWLVACLFGGLGSGLAGGESGGWHAEGVYD